VDSHYFYPYSGACWLLLIPLVNLRRSLSHALLSSTLLALSPLPDPTISLSPPGCALCPAGFVGVSVQADTLAVDFFTLESGDKPAHTTLISRQPGGKE
jgi:hypothetical protein